MIRRLCNLKGWHKTTLHPTRGGLRILAALGIVISLLGASPSISAQATPVNGTIRFDMKLEPSKLVVCFKESITIRVSLHRIASTLAGSGTNDRTISSGPAIQGRSTDRSMGTIEPVWVVIGMADIDPEAAEFTFKAGENPGTAYLYFEGTINRYWLGTENTQYNAGGYHVAKPLQLQVKNCGYKIGGWNITMNGLVRTGGLSCGSPYGPWDLNEIATTSGSGTTSVSSLRIYIPFSEDGQATGFREEQARESNLKLDAFGIFTTTITPNSMGYQINIPATRMVGTWGFPPDLVLPRDEVAKEQVENIVPAEPGECSQP